MEIYKGIGNSKDYAHSLDMLDGVFFDKETNGNIGFFELLPKLYKKEYNHCENNMVVTENGEWKGAVGLFFDEDIVLGEKIICGGIGNVAVTKDCRGKGYMQDCMQMAMDKMIEKNADIGVLGGQRQRYEYFSFQPAGLLNKFGFNSSNLKHIYGKDFKSQLHAIRVKRDDKEYIEFIKSLYNSLPERVVRKDEMFYDYLISWCSIPYVFKDGEKLVGYCIIESEMNSINEIKAINFDYFKLIIPAIFLESEQKDITFESPEYETEYVKYFSNICEWQRKEHCSSFTVLNWEKFLKSQLKLKATYTPLCDGEASFLIHGYKQDEKFKISVKNNEISFSNDVSEPYELTHKQAMELFFSMLKCDIILKPEIAQWFPVPIFIHSANKV